MSYKINLTKRGLFTRIMGLAMATPYVNDLEVFQPELWAREALATFLDSMITSSLVHRDFEDEVQQYGDTVNIPKPGTFEAKRKHLHDNVTIQDAAADKISVKLDQFVHTSFMIYDGEERVGFPSLIETFLKPAVEAQARMVDQVVLGQYMQFLDNAVGELGGLDATNSKAFMLALREKMNTNSVPVSGRNLALTAGSETDLLSNDLFMDASKVGDDGTALREASLGRKIGFDMYLALTAPVVNVGNTAKVGAINNGAGYAAGTTVLVVDGFTGAVTTGSWLWITGEGYPHRVSAHTETTSNTTGITLETGLKSAVADNDVITVYTPGAVDNASGYAIGWAKEITVDAFTVAPQIGQGVTFGTSLSTPKYTIIAVNGLVGITLDRPLEVALTDDMAVNLAPPGSYNLAFHKNAIALVNRPLPLPRAGTGALSSVQTYNDLSVRVTITYDGNKQGHLVTVDMLIGVKVLDDDLGAILLG